LPLDGLRLLHQTGLRHGDLGLRSSRDATLRHGDEERGKRDTCGEVTKS